MQASACFSQTYAEARAKFGAAAEARGLALERHVHPWARGADGEELSIDCALLGDARADRLLVLSSGTHGVEGYCGSGVQSALLGDAGFLAQARNGVAVLFVHAVNPYGFSHWMRANEDNVDLNRNFVDHGTPRASNARYAEVHPWLVSEVWPPAAATEQAIAGYVAERGQFAFQEAVSGGQYEFADGLFYGGREPAWSNRRLRGLLQRFAGSVRRLRWIDFHTGLGPYAHGEMIHAGRDRAADHDRAVAIWGPEVKSIYQGTSVSARLEGMAVLAAYDALPAAEFAGIAIEYGTLPVLEVLQALRAENWLRRNPQADAGTRARLRRQLRDAFYCDADDWKARVLEQGRRVAHDALASLGATA